MRKLLMATVAILGATGGLAMAQTATSNPSQGTWIGPYGVGPGYNNNNDAWPNPLTPAGNAAAGGLSGYAYIGPHSHPVPKPGTVIIRLGGKVLAEVDAWNASGMNADGYKLQPVGIGGYMRLYPGIDAMATNGIRYGGSIELRENFNQTTASPSFNTSMQTVYVRRAYTYLASEKAGLVRLGSGDGLIGLYDPCIFTSQCWDAGVGVTQGGFLQAAGPTNVTGAGGMYPWLAQAGAEYGNYKVVYLSPQYYGFDVGIQYAPNSGNSFGNSGTPYNTVNPCGTIGSACNGLAASPSVADGVKFINQTAFGLRYEHTFGSVDVKAYGVYEISGHTSVPGEPYDGLSFGQAGLAITTHAVTLAATYIGGRDNGQLGLVRKGGADMSATIVGLTWINGPLVVGGDVGFVDDQGDNALVGKSQEHNFTAAFGGNYAVGPGMNIVLEYQYLQRHQGGHNYLTGGEGTAYNDVKAQGVTLATMLTW